MPAATAASPVSWFDNLIGGVGDGLNTYLGYKIQRETIEDQIKLATAEQRLAESQKNASDVRAVKPVTPPFNWQAWATGGAALVGTLVALKLLKVI